MGSEQLGLDADTINYLMSPSHPVGLELDGFLPCSVGFLVVTIPRGGLGKWVIHGKSVQRAPRRHPTQWARNRKAKVFIKRNGKWILSPSHTVGLERMKKNFVRRCARSHHPTQWARTRIKRREHLIHHKLNVSIPHSGLGTGKYQAFFKLSEPATSPSHPVGLGRWKGKVRDP